MSGEGAKMEKVILLTILFLSVLAQGSETIVKEALLKENATQDQLTALLAIAKIESSFRPNAIGKAKEQGLWQFHPKYFKLKDNSIKNQTKLAIKHYNWLLTNGCKKNMIAICWNLGITGANKIKDPSNFKYNKKFKSYKGLYVEQERRRSQAFQISDSR